MTPAQVVAEEKKRLKQLQKDEKRKKKEEKDNCKKRKREEKQAARVQLASTQPQSQEVYRLVQPPPPPPLVNCASQEPDTKRRRPNDVATLRVSSDAIFVGLSLPLAADGQTIPPFVDYASVMTLKVDHASRPVTLLPTGYVYLDMNCPYSKPAADFLTTIAEPVSRPENIHEYQITVFSLYAAIGVGITIDEVITNLSKFSKNEIPPNLELTLRMNGGVFGRVKLVLRDNHYYLEARSREDLEYMLSDPTIAKARIRNSTATRLIRSRPTSLQSTVEEMKDYIQNQMSSDGDGVLQATVATLDPSILGFKLTSAGESAAAEVQPLLAAPHLHRTGSLSSDRPQSSSAGSSSGLVKQVFLFQIQAEDVGKVKEVALTKLKRPLVSEYDFRRDLKNPSLEIALKSTTKIRYYQERALRKMFSNGRARSGIIVLPCGAGKTLTGITAATTVRKSTMVITSSSVAVDQWKRAFTDFTNVDGNRVIALTSEKKTDLPLGAAVLCSTYTMMAYSGKRSADAERIIQQIQSREWGLLIFDEVQFAPAPAFRRINDTVKSHCTLGLTATLVREDDLIHDLQWLIGPKLYEANWLELQEAGYLAKVQVSEVWCPMSAEFYREYLRQPHARQRKLWVCNPNKLRVCEFLVRFHEARSDKIIVFSDNLFALKEVAFALKRPFVSGEVGMQERMIILGKFKNTNQVNTIFLSKVGDNAIDIPCANVVIQISFNFASRRQEAQRLGRILRPKPKVNEEFNAFFYSLVSKDTQEMKYADKRQQFIIDQGYAYKVLPIDVFPMDQEDLVFDDTTKQRDMLRRILSTGDKDEDLELDDVNLADSCISDTVSEAVDGSLGPTVAPKRTTLARMTRKAGTTVYQEGGRRAQQKKPTGEVHAFFKPFFKHR